jgi:hypothetical protein
VQEILAGHDAARASAGEFAIRHGDSVLDVVEMQRVFEAFDADVLDEPGTGDLARGGNAA